MKEHRTEHKISFGPRTQNGTEHERNFDPRIQNRTEYEKITVLPSLIGPET